MGSIVFDLRAIPHSEGEESMGYYPVVAQGRTFSSEALYEVIERRCTLTGADVKAVLAALADVLGEQLSQGVRVKVDELGTFAPKLACEYRITSLNDMQTARHLHIDNIDFRPKKTLLQKMSDVTFRRTEVVGSEVAHLTDEEMKSLITDFFASGEKPAMDRSDFARMTGYRTTRAKQALNKLTDEGFLIRNGKRNAPYYTLSSNVTNEKNKNNEESD